MGYGASCVVKSGIDTHNNSKVAIKLFKELNVESFKLMQNELSFLLTAGGHAHILNVV